IRSSPPCLMRTRTFSRRGFMHALHSLSGCSRPRISFFSFSLFCLCLHLLTIHPHHMSCFPRLFATYCIVTSIAFTIPVHIPSSISLLISYCYRFPSTFPFSPFLCYRLVLHRIRISFYLLLLRIAIVFCLHCACPNCICCCSYPNLCV
ncbi:hypothetical protein CPB85DRAFT_1312069, partial [Mucidula mucida]